MKRDLHYYALLALCRYCGFDKKSARIISYASQYVDDAKINLITIRNPKPGIECDLINSKPAFYNMATCQAYFKIKTFDYAAMINNTCAFHFVPGCDGISFTSKLRCKEASPVIMDILNQALTDPDLVKLGIVFHAYADTYSHQGFSGLPSKVNDIKKCNAINEVYLESGDFLLYLFKHVFIERFDAVFDRIIPAYGHGQAMSLPDLPYLIWTYTYDCSEEFHGEYRAVSIDNRERYQRAIVHIKHYLLQYLFLHPQFGDKDKKKYDFDRLMKQLIQKGSDKNREEAWISFMLEQGMYCERDIPTIVYYEDDWVSEAFIDYDKRIFNNRRVLEAKITKNFDHTCWYRFYLAVKWYKKLFFTSCRKHALFISDGISI